MPVELISQTELDGLREDARQTIEVDEVLIERITVGSGQLLPNGFRATDTRTLVYAGPAAIYPILSRRDRFDEVAEGLVFTRQYRVDLPWDCDNVQIRDRVTVTASQDPQMLDREFEVRDVVVETNIAVRRLTVHDFRE